MRGRRPSWLTIMRGLLDLVLVALVAVVLLAVVLGRGAPIVGAQTLIIGGPSMEPTLPLGSAVVIRPVRADEITVGDIVSIKSGAETAIFTHRVVRLLTLQGEPYIETKGDNNPAPDGATVPATAVIGQVTAYLPLMGYVIALLSVPSGVAFALGLGAFLILAALLLDSVDVDRRHGRLPTQVSRGAPAAPSAMVVGSPDTEAGAASVAALVRRRRPDRLALGTESAGGEPRGRHTRRSRTPRPTA